MLIPISDLTEVIKFLSVILSFILMIRKLFKKH